MLAPGTDHWCLELDGVTKSFGDTHALRSLSLSARRGAVTAILGPNGAGKTTLMEICEGLQNADGGLVRVLGLDPRRDAAELRPRVGVMVQDGGLPIMARPLELLRHVSRMYAAPRAVDELVDLLGLDAFARTSVRRLSGGQRQRLALAIALVGRPDLVFLDEPSAGLDPQARLVVWDLIEALRADGVSVILSTHLMDEAARLADHVAIIDHGAVLAQGTVAELTESVGVPAAMSAPSLEAPDGSVGSAAPPTPHAARLSGPLTPAARTALAQLAEAHGLTLELELELEGGARTLEDVFLDLTGRSLR
ncbi:ABC transporter ATP-binding protein [Occultella aeris]|uniref:Daunorubicin/doxorubicin resistance ATP-binding protein DrrA n=1 Tax=Occultella aeris TaxID=2761496 RepID=A0A7M4DR68_9MICO|nr:ABC transporter ATP-binding protein [Occultella aeris]VZO39962.1 Daunorubicin/doxorubicin resistance ATP-binding protein DrrA [Occultella aeris]